MTSSWSLYPHLVIVYYFIIFVLTVFIRSCFVCAIVGLFMLLKEQKIIGVESVFLVWCWYKDCTVWHLQGATLLLAKVTFLKTLTD